MAHWSNPRCKRVCSSRSTTLCMAQEFALVVSP